MSKHISGDIDIECIKRCYVSNATLIKLKCTGCGSDMWLDLSSNYLSYPKVGKNSTVYICCGECDKEFDIPIKVESAKIVVTCNTDKLKEA